jgi:hypothetical protein
MNPWIRNRLRYGESHPERRFGRRNGGSGCESLGAKDAGRLDAALPGRIYRTDLAARAGTDRRRYPDPRTTHRCCREQDPHFTNCHRVLNRNQWSGRWIARCLLRLLINAFVPTGPAVIGLDDTIERRWGAKISARGIYRDPVRSSDSHFVKASGLRWLSLMLLPQIRWAGRVWALPFLTVLAPSLHRPSGMRANMTSDTRS